MSSGRYWISQRSVWRCIVHRAASAIRRQRDTGTHSRSLAATLLDMANHPAAARSWSGEFIDVHLLREHRRELERSSSDIARFATHAIAHATDVRVRPIAFDTLHAAVPVFASIVQRYSALLLGVTLIDRGDTFLPTWLAGERFEPMHPTLEEWAAGQPFNAYIS